MRSQCSIVESRCAMTMVVRPRIRLASAVWIARSDSVSSAEVASSRIRIGASLRIARAIAMRCRWPPDSRTPRSPTCVSKPAGIASMKSSAFAARAASTIASREAPAIAP